MKQFYVVKNRNYTTICNVALRDRALSLKAKGLYCFIASLPSEWDYTVAGLVTVLKEGRDAVLNALQELEKAGYLHRGRVRRKDGTFGEAVYFLTEHPTTEPVNGFSDVGKAQAKDNNFVIKESEKRKSKKKRSKVMGDASQHFANERTYTQEELDGLIDDIDDIEF